MMADDETRRLAEGIVKEMARDAARPEVRRARASRRDGKTCGKCGRALGPAETVWMMPLMIPGLAIRIEAPHCDECTSVDRQHPWFYARRCEREPRPCQGCARPVHRRWRRRRRLTFCSQRCREVYSARERRECRARMRFARSCPGCQKQFTPRRDDMVACSRACRQRLYRRRVTLRGTSLSE
jgi:hypothetical protein